MINPGSIRAGDLPQGCGDLSRTRARAHPRTCLAFLVAAVWLPTSWKFAPRAKNRLVGPVPFSQYFRRTAASPEFSQRLDQPLVILQNGGGTLRTRERIPAGLNRAPKWATTMRHPADRSVYWPSVSWNHALGVKISWPGVRSKRLS